MPDVPTLDATSLDVPAGFRLFTIGGPYFRALGPVYLRDDAQPQVLAL